MVEDTNKEETFQPIIEKAERERFSLESFSKMTERMVQKSEEVSGSNWYMRSSVNREESVEEVDAKLARGNLQELVQLSESFFKKDGFYKRLIVYYASLLKYTGILIPNPKVGQNLSQMHVKKRYIGAVNFLNRANLPVFLADCAQKVLRRGAYYGLILSKDENGFSVLDLPYSYSRSTFKTESGIDIIELDLNYFNSVLKNKNDVLASYPKFVRREYHKLMNGKRVNSWLRFSPEDGIYFNLWDNYPFFVSMISAIVRYDEAVDTEMERDKEEIKKIIVQKIEHLNNGDLLFQPEEAEQIHIGTVGMLKGNKNVSVLTTYADVDEVSSKIASDAQRNSLEKMVQNIYSYGGTSSQLFASTGSATLATSIRNDLALMMHLANKFSFFITRLINSLFSNVNVSFKYEILPISYYNEEEYINNAFKMASSGYSFILPALAMGISQADLGNLKDLENEVLELDEKLKPLDSSYTQSGSGERGAPKKAEEEKSPKTIQNEESLDRQVEGGSN